MTIECKGLDKLLKQLEKRQKSLDDKLKELIEKLGAIGISEAQIRFNMAPYDGERDAEVGSLTWVNDNTAQIVASGRTVLFIEFGAGVYYNGGDTYGTEHGYGPGTYGPHGLEPYWFYEGDPGNAGGVYATGRENLTITHGNPASKPMYYAAKEMREKIADIAREVFG